MSDMPEVQDEAGRMLAGAVMGLFDSIYMLGMAQGHVVSGLPPAPSDDLRYAVDLSFEVDGVKYTLLEEDARMVATAVSSGGDGNLVKVVLTTEPAR